MLVGPLRVDLRLYHQAFFEKYRDRLPEEAQPRRAEGHSDLAKKKTLKSFSYQWNVFSEMYDVWKKNFTEYIQPLTPSDFQGKRVLDAGCGFGRHCYYAAQYGAETVAIDLSEAVEAAYRNTRALSNIHIVQADIYLLPFRRVFDLIYSIGVIQHLPDPGNAVLKIANALKPGARLFVWVYGRRKGIYNAVIPAVRRITTRLPLRLLYFVTFFLALLSYIFISLPYKGLSKISFLRNFVNKLPFTGYARYPLRVSHADWFDRLSVPITYNFQREDIAAWFQAAQLGDVQILSWKGISWKGLGAAPENPGEQWEKRIPSLFS